MQNVSAASKLLGRGDSGGGDPQEIGLGTTLSMVGTTLNATGGGGVSFGDQSTNRLVRGNGTTLIELSTAATLDDNDNLEGVQTIVLNAAQNAIVNPLEATAIGTGALASTVVTLRAGTTI